MPRYSASAIIDYTAVLGNLEKLTLAMSTRSATAHMNFKTLGCAVSVYLIFSRFPKTAVRTGAGVTDPFARA